MNLHSTCSAYPIAVTRILVGALWSLELLGNLLYGELIYGEAYHDFQVLFVGWFVSALCLCAGLFSRVSALINFLLGTFFMLRFGKIYHADYYAQMAIFYFIFIDAARVCSVDCLRLRDRRLTVSQTIWAFPISVFLLHLGTLYLDAALSHVLLNNSWREGYAVSQALINPMLNSSLGWQFATIPYAAEAINFFTLVFEFSFLPCVMLALLCPRFADLRLIYFLAGSAIHLGIFLLLDIGTFGLLAGMLLIPLLPDHFLQKCWRKREVSGNNSILAEDTRRTIFDKVFVAFAPLLLGCCLVVQVPFYSNEIMYGWIVRPASAILSALGDFRPHNVFCEQDTSTTFSLRFKACEDHGSCSYLPALFDEDGERIGLAANMRIFMSWLLRWKRPTSPLYNTSRTEWNEHFRSAVTPLLRFFLKLPLYSKVRSIEVTYLQQKVPKGLFWDHNWNNPTIRLMLGQVKVEHLGGVPKLEFIFPSE